MKLLPIGISDFKQVIEGNYYYVDKTLLIQELLESAGQVVLIPRPRRFGKTLNLSMLKYFFESTSTSNEHLFYNTYIWNREKHKIKQGKYPVIFLTFKGIKANTWIKAYEYLVFIIAEEFRRHAPYLLPQLPEYERRTYEALLYKRASQVEYSQSLLFLSELLKRYHNQHVIVLIDEYDAPIHTAYAYGYYKDLISFMQELLTAVLKDNHFLERAILSGILRTAKEGIFSGLNNLSVFTMLNKEFCDKFGFTPSEVYELLKEQKLLLEEENIKNWYNGYHANGATLYNPWSLLECVRNRGILKPYWANTSDNHLVKKLVARANEEAKVELESLLVDVPVIKEIDEKLAFPTLEQSSTALWSLLLWTGYVTYSFHEIKEGKDICTLILPNTEIKLLYKHLLQEIVEQSLPGSRSNALLQALNEANISQIAQLLQEFVLNSMSAFDIPDTEPERSYHLFVLGLLVTISDYYEVSSNRESGYGRYDIMLIPKDITKPGFVIEFKKVTAFQQETLETAAQKALEQIEEKKYAHELKKRGIKTVLALGIAFKGKQVLLKAQNA